MMTHSPFAHCFTSCLVWASLLVCAQAQGRQDDPFIISVQVNLVVLHATVSDHRNLLVSGLNSGDFQVIEDGVPQEIKQFRHEDIPVTVGLVIDNSGSMKPKRSAVRAAALAFAHTSNPKDRMFVVNFNEKVSLGLPAATAFTDDPAILEAALDNGVATGETALYDAIAIALDHLSKGERDKKVLIVISDGGDNASKRSLQAILAMAKRSDAAIYTVGLFDVQDGDRNPDVLKRLAVETGGESFLPDAISDVLPICERIARDLRSQYTLAYVSSNVREDGAYRLIQVKAGGSSRGRLVGSHAQRLLCADRATCRGGHP